MRRVDQLLDQYSDDHQNATNQSIHLLCVPAIVWTVTAFLWVIPVPEFLGKPGSFAVLGMFLAWLWYWKLSHKLALGLLACFFASILLNLWISTQFGMKFLLMLAIGVFVVAWIGQFIGHKVEGKRPSFLTDLVYLLVGPMWTLRKLYNRLGIGY